MDADANANTKQVSAGDGMVEPTKRGTRTKQLELTNKYP